MSSKFKNKYRNESSRLPNWDYGSSAAYFITICTKDREHYFGEIKNGKMQFSPAGAIAHVLWDTIRNRVNNIQLGEFVIMPNHVHGIIIIDGNDDSGGGDDNCGNNNRGDENSTDVACNVPTIPEIPPIPGISMIPSIPTMDQPETNPENHKNERMAAISPKSNSVSTIIRSYKSAVTKYCNRLDLPLVWQSRFHDHIIRNDQSFYRISNYIRNNPSNWKEDVLF